MMQDAMIIIFSYLLDDEPIKPTYTSVFRNKYENTWHNTSYLTHITSWPFYIMGIWSRGMGPVIIYGKRNCRVPGVMLQVLFVFSFSFHGFSPPSEHLTRGNWTLYQQEHKLCTAIQPAMTSADFHFSLLGRHIAPLMLQASGSICWLR